MIVDTARMKLEHIKRGTLIQMCPGMVVGFVIADDIAYTPEDEPRPFMRDTGGGRHFPDADGCITVGLAGFRTQEYGKVPGKDTQGHALLGMVPGRPPAGLCPASRNLGNRLSVWSSGTALTGVTCLACRKMIGLVNTPPKRESNGI